MDFGTNKPMVRTGYVHDTVYTNNTPYMQMSTITIKGSNSKSGDRHYIVVNDVEITQYQCAKGMLSKKVFNVPVPPYGTIKVCRGGNNGSGIEAWVDILTADIPTGYSLVNRTGWYGLNTDYVNDSGGDIFLIADLLRTNATATYLIVNGVAVGVFGKSHAGQHPLFGIIPRDATWRLESGGCTIKRMFMWTK